MEEQYKVVWPLGRSVYETFSLAARRSSLDGQTICEIWDWLFRGPEVFPTIREALRRQYPAIKIVEYDKFPNTHGHNEREVVPNLPKMLRDRGCNAVISGIGA